MTTTPELKPNIPDISQNIPKEVGETSKEAPAPLETQIQPTAGPFQVQPADTPAPQAAPADDSNIVTITVPATAQQLEDWSKGSPDNALTWLAFYWIRMIKKALFHGYRVITAQAQPA